MFSRMGSFNSIFVWRSVPDWIQLGVAVGLFLIAIFSPNGDNAHFNTVWGILLAVLLAGVALWALALTVTVASIAEILTGVFLFVSPWLGSASGGWSWVAWIVGILVVFVGTWSYFSMPTTTTSTNAK